MRWSSSGLGVMEKGNVPLVFVASSSGGALLLWGRLTSRLRAQIADAGPIVPRMLRWVARKSSSALVPAVCCAWPCAGFFLVGMRFRGGAVSFCLICSKLVPSDELPVTLLLGEAC